MVDALGLDALAAAVGPGERVREERDIGVGDQVGREVGGGGGEAAAFKREGRFACEGGWEEEGGSAREKLRRRTGLWSNTASLLPLYNIGIPVAKIATAGPQSVNASGGGFCPETSR